MIALRIDVDFACDLFAGVPYMLDELSRRGMKASFFVAAGGRTGHRGGWLARLASPEYVRRYWSLGPWRILTRMAPATLRAGGDRLRHGAPVLRRILSEGHELGLHGFDHTWWADNAWSASDADLGSEIDRARQSLRSEALLECREWASPAWRTSDRIVSMLHARGVTYLTECWGREPFVTVTATGGEIPVPHLPITLPSLEALRITRGLSPTAAVMACLDRCSPDRWDVMCMHGYYEGLIERETFPLFLEECHARDYKIVTLRRMKELVVASGAPLPRCRLARGRLPGFTGEVSIQEGDSCYFS